MFWYAKVALLLNFHANDYLLDLLIIGIYIRSWQGDIWEKESRNSKLVIM